MRQLDEETTISRHQKVMAAKAAFRQGSSARTQPRQGSFAGDGVKKDYRTLGAGVDTTASARGMDNWRTGERPAPEEEWQSRRGFGLLRFMTSAMLLMVLMAAFHMGFSYEGFDRAYVQEKLNDETSWNRLEKQVQQVYLSLEKQFGK